MEAEVTFSFSFEKEILPVAGTSSSHSMIKPPSALEIPLQWKLMASTGMTALPKLF